MNDPNYKLTPEERETAISYNEADDHVIIHIAKSKKNQATIDLLHKLIDEGKGKVYLEDQWFLDCHIDLGVFNFFTLRQHRNYSEEDLKKRKENLKHTAAK